MFWSPWSVHRIWPELGKSSSSGRLWICANITCLPGLHIWLYRKTQQSTYCHRYCQHLNRMRILSVLWHRLQGASPWIWAPVDLRAFADSVRLYHLHAMLLNFLLRGLPGIYRGLLLFHLLLSCLGRWSQRCCRGRRIVLLGIVDYQSTTYKSSITCDRKSLQTDFRRNW